MEHELKKWNDLNERARDLLIMREVLGIEPKTFAAVSRDGGLSLANWENEILTEADMRDWAERLGPPYQVVRVLKIEPYTSNLTLAWQVVEKVWKEIQAREVFVCAALGGGYLAGFNPDGVLCTGKNPAEAICYAAAVELGVTE